MAQCLLGMQRTQSVYTRMLLFLHCFRRTWQVILFILAAAPLCLAQVQYANSVVSTQNAGFVFDDYKAADGDLTTNATISPLALLGFTRIRVKFPVMAQANKPAGLYLRPNDPLLNLALAGLASVNTYMETGGNTTAVESFPLSSNLINLSLLTGGINKANFMPTKPFNQVEIVFVALLSLGQNIGVFEAFSTPVAPLPVVLTKFQGKATSTGAALQWETASELTTSHFVVERASGATSNFRAIGRVGSAGTSSQRHQYQFLDGTLAQLSYYRLRQVDLDGTETFSPVVVVQTEVVTLAAYPNPVTSLLTVLGSVGTTFIIMDQAGRQVGSATITENTLPQLDVSNLPAGLYFVQDCAAGKRARFVKATQ